MGKRKRKADAARSRGLKRYWNDVHEIARDRGAEIARARKLYRAALDRAELDRGDVNRDELLGLVGKIKRLPPEKKKAPPPPTKEKRAARALREEVVTAPIDALDAVKIMMRQTKTAKGEPVEPVTEVFWIDPRENGTDGREVKPPVEAELVEAHKTWLDWLEEWMKEQIEENEELSELLSEISRLQRYVRIIASDTVGAKIAEGPSGRLVVSHEFDLDGFIEEVMSLHE
jgi:hypothetical protein